MKKVLIAIPLLLLAGCFEPETGPGQIRYDRDTCEICRMIISDPRFGTQVRHGPDKELVKFDDIGDALHWVEENGHRDDPDLEIWVPDMDRPDTWLEARQAHYLAGQVTPMDYGYGALSTARDGSVSYEEMRTGVLARGVTSRCDTPNDPTHDHDHDHDHNSGTGT
ncbi:nitrous oxide reductase accessory protein NosL [Magnetospira sp. QH-2]|uniref:nitrous oxide reductase accessory protein NosL n=1 Tax=Magnetospira sp. (strain QH-2) TaxID=1288970 RepID=UPI0003E81076|nr:nitrous oxide reductase accessory protein NosL [Magnetospira sp. QH-2]CCQ73145.1 Conserved protein of unknown function [Magnetospira sp. QH-2]